MRYILIAILFFLWLLTTLQGVLFNVYLWQIKEYRLDRMLDYFRINRWKRQRTLPAWLIWGLTSYFFPVIGLVGIATLAGGTALQLGRHTLKRPVPTTKAILTLAGTGGVFVVTMTLQFFQGQLWVALLPGGGIRTDEMVLLIRLLLLDRLLVPFIVAGILSALYIPSEIAKRKLIWQATQKVAATQLENVIGITGSYGKTSTKTFLATILAAQHPIFQTHGGTNIDVAIAHQILSDLQPDHKQMVVEMGAYRAGEVASICGIVKPNIGIWTAVNEQHLSLFGNLEGTLRAKYELIAALPPDGAAILNGDDPRVMAKTAEWPGRKVIYSQEDTAKAALPPADIFGSLGFAGVMSRYGGVRGVGHPAHPHIWESPRQFPKSHIFAADVRVTPNRLGFVVHHRGKRQVFDVNVTGRHNLPNLLAAIAAALEAGMTLAEIAGAARQITPIEGTLQPRRGRKGTLLIDSSYSSNPDGVRAALDYLSIFDDKKKVMLFPGIIELGSESGRIHVELGEKIAGACDMLVILKDDFIEPLLAGIQKSGAQIETLHGLDTGQIHARLWELTGRDTVMLFEGRGTAQYMTPLLTQPPIPNP